MAGMLGGGISPPSLLGHSVYRGRLSRLLLDVVGVGVLSGHAQTSGASGGLGWPVVRVMKGMR